MLRPRARRAGQSAHLGVGFAGQAEDERGFLVLHLRTRPGTPARIERRGAARRGAAFRAFATCHWGLEPAQALSRALHGAKRAVGGGQLTHPGVRSRRHRNLRLLHVALRRSDRHLGKFKALGFGGEGEVRPVGGECGGGRRAGRQAARFFEKVRECCSELEPLSTLATTPSPATTATAFDRCC